MTKGHRLSWDTFAWHRLVFNSECSVIRETPVKSGQWTGKSLNFPSVTCKRGQFASCEYPFNIDFNSSSADFIDLAWNLPCIFSTNGKGKTGSNA